MASGRRTPDPMRIASAQITGAVERCVIAHGLTEDAALVAIGAALGPVPEAAWPAVLANAATHYVDGTSAAQLAAMALLVRAGADPDRARRIKAQPRASFQVR